MEAKPFSPMRRRALDKLLIQYLELPESDQPAWLAHTARRLPRLGSRLQSLIQNSHTITLLDDSVRRLAGDSVDRIEINTRRMEPGDHLGPWEVAAEVGQGGMGRVYHGRRADGAFEMEVAIKLIGQRRRGLADLLQRECRLLARLDHPAVTRLVDAGLDDKSGPFLVMEWVEGMDLADWLVAENPDLDTRLRLFERIAEAVAHAHQRLIVHGDIKPSNIRIRDDGLVKLMDFGVARLLESDEAEQLELRALTPPFAAPEQRAGEDITPASDIWSLGAVLYWLLTREVLTQSTGPLALTLTKYRLPRNSELAAIIETACAASSSQRYTSANDLLNDIRRYRADEPLSCMKPAPPTRMLKFARRNPLLVGTAALLALSMTAGLVFSTMLYLRAENERQIAERSEHAARTVTAQQQAVLSNMAPATLADSLVLGLRAAIRNAELSEAHMQKLNEVIDIANPVDILRDALVSNVLEPAEQRMADELDDNPETAAALVHSLATVRADWGMHGEAQAGFESAWQLRQQVLGEAHPDTLSSRISQAVEMNDAGASDSALELIRPIYDKAVSILGENHPQTLAAGHAYGGVLLQKGQPNEAIGLLQATRAGREKRLGPDHADTLNTAASLAVAKVHASQLQAAGEMFEHVYERRRETLGRDHEATLASVHNLAGFRFQTGDIDSGLELIDLAIDISTRLHGQRHPATLQYQYNKAQILINLGHWQDALELHQQVYEISIAVLGEAHPRALLSSQQIAVALGGLGRHEEALERSAMTYEVMARTLGPSYPETLLAQQNVGRFMLEAGQTDTALEQIEKAHQGLLQSTRSDSNHTLISLIHLISALDRTQRFSQADALIDTHPALPKPAQGPVLVDTWRRLYHTIALMYQNWHAESPAQGHDETSAYWEALMNGLNGD